jgi:hypothetical protein
MCMKPKCLHVIYVFCTNTREEEQEGEQEQWEGNQQPTEDSLAKPQPK